MAALPSSHPAASQRRVAMKTLSQDFFIVISEQTYPGAAHFVTEACRAAGFRPEVSQTPERGYTILALVAANCGLTLLPESLQALPNPGVVFRPLLAPQELTSSLLGSRVLSPSPPMVSSIHSPRLTPDPPTFTSLHIGGQNLSPEQ